jgi:hypothetical protein
MINEGDEVSVVFTKPDGDEFLWGIVIYTPCATGDTWKIMDYNGMIHAINPQSSSLEMISVTNTLEG